MIADCFPLRQAASSGGIAFGRMLYEHVSCRLAIKCPAERLLTPPMHGLSSGDPHPMPSDHAGVPFRVGPR